MFIEQRSFSTFMHILHATLIVETFSWNLLLSVGMLHCGRGASLFLVTVYSIYMDEMTIKHTYKYHKTVVIIIIIMWKTLCPRQWKGPCDITISQKITVNFSLKFSFSRAVAGEGTQNNTNRSKNKETISLTKEMNKTWADVIVVSVTEAKTSHNTANFTYCGERNR